MVREGGKNPLLALSKREDVVEEIMEHMNLKYTFCYAGFVMIYKKLRCMKSHISDRVLGRVGNV